VKVVLARDCKTLMPVVWVRNEAGVKYILREPSTTRR